jgi:hypothetical protein
MRGLRRKQDKLTVGHVHDQRKDFLPFNMKPNYIREIYSCKLLKIGSAGSYTSAEFQGGGEETTKSMLWGLAK